MTIAQGPGIDRVGLLCNLAQPSHPAEPQQLGFPCSS